MRAVVATLLVATLLVGAAPAAFACATRVQACCCPHQPDAPHESPRVERGCGCELKQAPHDAPSSPPAELASTRELAPLAVDAPGALVIAPASAAASLVVSARPRAPPPRASLFAQRTALLL